MPFRPLRDDEIKEVEAKIEEVKRNIATRHRYLMELEQRLKEGVWDIGEVAFQKILEEVAEIVRRDSDATNK